MGDLTPNFSRYEFACKCGCGADHVNPELVALLEQMRARLGRPIEILSGVRCAAHNRREGGTKGSQHILGNAADIRIAGYTPTQIAILADRLLGNSGGVKPYTQDHFCHVDVREGFWRG